MTKAQRAALKEVVRIGELMRIFGQMPLRHRATIRDVQQRWDAVRNRYFELEAEAAKVKSSARKSRGAVRQRGGAK